jgi:hypothetical protein
MKRTLIVMVLVMACSLKMQAQDKIKEQLFYYSPKGLTFIPPLSRPGLVYNGHLYVGKKKLGYLFNELHDMKLDIYFMKYKANKTSADILTFVGGFALPIANIFISTNQGKINWWLLGTSVVLNGTGGYLNMQAQKNLLLASIYYDQKMGYPHNAYVPQQQSVGIAIPLTK